MCVHVKKWREDAQPEWPAAASEAEVVPSTGEAKRRRAGEAPGYLSTQSFPDTGLSGVLGGHPGHTHDPHEVTVQLDAVSPQQDLRMRQSEGGPAGGAESADGPVFVDESGRRSRTFRRLGIAVGIACAVYAVVIVVTLLSGSSDAPWLPVPDQKDEQPAGQVEPTSLPAESVRPSGTGSVPSGSTPTAGAGRTPSPGASDPAPSGSTGSARPGASTAPDPTPTRSTANPGPGVDHPLPSTSANPTTPGSPDPDPSPGTGSPDPTQSAVGPGTGTVADGPSNPSPITAPFSEHSL